MTMNKEQLIEAVLKADIDKSHWAYELIELVEDRYARGYLSAVVKGLGETIDSSDEEYREDLLRAIEYDIWEE